MQGLQVSAEVQELRDETAVQDLQGALLPEGERVFAQDAEEQVLLPEALLWGGGRPEDVLLPREELQVSVRPAPEVFLPAEEPAAFERADCSEEGSLFSLQRDFRYLFRCHLCQMGLFFCFHP